MPAAPTPASGTFRLNAREGYTRVVLEGPGGTWIGAGQSLPVGTYPVWVDWVDFGFKPAGTVSITANTVTVVTCYAERTLCNSK